MEAAPVESPKNLPTTPKPIDEGFDWVGFPDLPLKEQVKCIPDEMLDPIELNDTEKAFCHTCVLKKHTNSNSGWACDTVLGTKVCRRGITGFYQSNGIDGWRCASCDFDLCDKCMKLDKLLNALRSRED